MNARSGREGDSAIPLRQVDGGVTIELLARPGARRSAILGLQSGRLKLAVTAPAHDGQANAAIIALIAKKLGVPKSGCAILRGQSGRLKTLFVSGVTQEQAIAALEIH